MSYTLTEIKLAAYNWDILPDMSQAERSLWEGLGYAYECYRNGEDKTACDELARKYVDFYKKGMMGIND